jgi:hypothetical protein
MGDERNGAHRQSLVLDARRQRCSRTDCHYARPFEVALFLVPSAPVRATTTVHVPR